jgi:DNA-binding beta-propeller fold protein YncE
MPLVQTRLLNALILGAVLASFHSMCRGQTSPDTQFSTREAVGQIGANRYYTPANQILTPAGIQVELPGMRPQAIALSPNGRLLVTSGKTHDLVVIEPATGKIVQRVALPSDRNSGLAPEAVAEEILHPDRAGQLSFTGLVFSPDGTRIYLANVDGNVKVFGVRKTG